MKKSKNIKIAAYFILLASCLSCKKFLQIPPPETQLEEIKVFQTDQTAISAVAGLYSRVTNSPLLSMVNGGTTLYTGLAADEIRNPASIATADPYLLNTLLPATGSISTNFWIPAYRNIF